MVFRWADVGRLGSLFWGVVAVGAVLTLARFSEAFLILRAEDARLPLALVPLVLVVMNAVYAASAYPMGALSDRYDRRLVVGAGFVGLALADIVLAFAPGIGAVMVGIVLWGLHMGMTPRGRMGRVQVSRDLRRHRPRVTRRPARRET